MQQAARLLAICVFGLGAVAQTGTAEACAKIDRAAEMAVINKAIASPDTPADKKTALQAIHDELRVFQKKKVWEGNDNGRVGDLLRKGMDLAGHKRILYVEPVKKPAKPGQQEVFTYSAPVPKTAPIKTAAAEAPLQPSCG